MWRLDLRVCFCVSDMSYVHHPNYIRLNVTSSCCINVVSHLPGFFFIFILQYTLRSGNCFFNLPWVWVYWFEFNLLQLILRFYKLCLKKVVEVVPFGLKAHVAFSKYTSLHIEVLLVNLKHCMPVTYCHTTFSANIITGHLSFNMFHK
jgi:hypothetical protein